jgi:uncharacterized RDD family membrane protein YckC
MTTNDAWSPRSGSYDTDVVGERALAQVIDWIAIFAVTVLLAVVTAAATRSQGVTVLVAALTAFVYNTGLEAVNGQTVGKHLTGITVRSRRGAPASLGQVAIRNVPALFSPGLLLYFVALLSIATDREDRRLFDMAADTVVVRGY